MPFQKVRAHKLTLAITAALLSQSELATAANAGWDCEAVDGSWSCAEKSSQALGAPRQTTAAPAQTPANPTSTNGQSAVAAPAVSSAAKPTVQPAATQTAPATSRQGRYSYLDWYPQRRGDGQLCAGQYIQPELPEGDGTPFSEQPVVIDADKGIAQLGLGTELTGSVKIVQGQRSLYSSSALIDQETGQITLSGGATYREPGMLLTGKRAESNTNTATTTLYDAEYVLHEQRIRGSVAKVSRNEDRTITITDGTYTQCPPGVESWQVAASEIQLDQASGFGRAENATLRLGNVPVLYVPIFYFPIDDKRLSGFLYPSIRYTSSEGLELSTPYYFNIAPHMDDTLTPRYFEKRGLMLENEFRYMNEYSLNTLSTAVLPDDRRYGDTRWLLGLEHDGKQGAHWRSKIDYLAVSDNDYFDDVGSGLDITEQSHLNRYARLSYIESQWQAHIALQSYQTIDDTLAPYRRLPQISFIGTPNTGKSWLDARYLIDFNRFDRDLDGLTGADRIIGDRIHFEPTLTASFRNQWGYVKPSAKFWYTQYSLDNQLAGLDETPSVAVPVLSIDSGVVFERDTHIIGNDYMQTLEPRLFGLYVPEKDQSHIPDFDSAAYDFSYRSLFRDNRFSGQDRIGDAQQISMGVTTRLIDDQGREAVSASVGQAYFFEKPSVKLNEEDAHLIDDKFSDIATTVNWRPNQRVIATFDANFDHTQFQNTENNFSVRYEEDINRIASFSYRFKEDVREQSTASFIWPVNNRWSTLGVWQYDWLNEDDIDTAFGVEYESCCWRTRVIARRWLKDNDEKDNSIYIQFMLKGLGNFGTSGGSTFLEKITGFEQREENNEYY
ncbi:LPS assembly protein LptD [Neptunomonas sp. XY-337]|uniref:LPS-assembly protein LptD n=1 Tax=Neptunomonas sp. XY-337 TaxID=2561897 RepID=UPI00145B1857|nr:LPS assembly protein LptD [Neptunomonas sp. XY-337]